jgi:hypothetical protein
MSRPFLKMNGLGNDFVVVEARSEPFASSEAEARAIADRGGGGRLRPADRDRAVRARRRSFC